MVELKTIETVDTSPFKHLIMSIGELPSSFVDSMTYYECLAWLVNYIQNTVIPAVNNNAEATQELQDAFVTLKNYVDHYFDNLDVQEEVNTKLDAMVEDGTLAEIINQEIFSELNNEIGTANDNITAINTKIGTMTDLNTVNKDTLVKSINSANENYITTFRRKYGNNYQLFTTGISYFDNNVRVYKDIFSNSFDYYINLNNYKNTGGTTYYVNPDTAEAVGSQTGALDHPYGTIKQAWLIADDGDTIALFGGIYTRSKVNITPDEYYHKSINIIAYNGTPYITNADDLTYTQNATYSNVYQTTRSGTVMGIDMRGKDKDVFARLTKVASLAECSETLDSYYTSGSTVYVNIGEVPNKNKVIFPLSISAPMMPIKSTTANLRIYLEGLCCLGGDLGIITIESSDSYTCEVIATECRFYFATNNTNAMTVKGANTIFHKCKACFACRDGFNYHLAHSKNCNSIELDCVGAYNGLLTDTSNNNNGSTTHDGNKALRINCTYFNNGGPNVCDVNLDTHTFNINCASFDSKGTGQTVKSDFYASDGGSTMDLYNCYSRGSNSYVNLITGSGNIMNVHNCIYDTTINNGTMNIE